MFKALYNSSPTCISHFFLLPKSIALWTLLALVADLSTTGFLFKFYLFILRERECACVGGAESEGERESQAGTPLLAQDPTWGLKPCTVRL